MTTTYEVIVGNIGTVHASNNPLTAVQDYEDYVELSKSQYGRASGEVVTLMEDNEPIEEHHPLTLNDIIDSYLNGNRDQMCDQIKEYDVIRFLDDLMNFECVDNDLRFKMTRTFIILTKLT